MAGDCGECTMCCRMFDIPELQKPANKWCVHCDIGKSCKIYNDRPSVCADFSCVWLEGRKKGVPFGDELRPDRCKIVFAQGDDAVTIKGFHLPGMENVLKNKSVRWLIDKLVAGNLKVYISTANGTTARLFDKSGEYSAEIKENGLMWVQR